MPETTHNPDIAPPLSPAGQTRREAIFVAMSQASRARRVRQIALRSASVCVSLGVLAWTAWLTLSPPVPRPVRFTGPIVAPAPSPKPALVPTAVVAQFVPPSPGIADRLAAPAPSPLVSARQLSDLDLQSVLAEDGAFGLARIHGRVYVMNNRPSTPEPASEMR